MSTTSQECALSHQVTLAVPLLSMTAATQATTLHPVRETKRSKYGKLQQGAQSLHLHDEQQ